MLIIKNMNRQKEIKSLTWIYFWQQKAEEIFKGLFIISGILSGFLVTSWIGYLVTKYLLGKGDCLREYGCLENSSIIGLIFIFLIGMIIYTFLEWAKSNWERAKERAKKEIKK